MEQYFCNKELSNLNDVPEDLLNLPMSLRVCKHLLEVNNRGILENNQNGCKECLNTGSNWVHLRICQTFGEKLCCESSPNKHAFKHFQNHNHLTYSSAEPGERWVYCYKDDIVINY